MSNLLTMSQKELTRAEVMQLKTKRLTQAEAAVQLGTSIRQLQRAQIALMHRAAKFRSALKK